MNYQTEEAWYYVLCSLERIRKQGYAWVSYSTLMTYVYKKIKNGQKFSLMIDEMLDAGLLFLNTNQFAGKYLKVTDRGRAFMVQMYSHYAERRYKDDTKDVG